jgi:hypothetical protein
VSRGRQRGHYDVLGVTPAVDTAGLRRAYRQLALAHHPDRAAPADRAAAAARTAELTAAYRVLADPAARRRYDADIGVAPRHRGHAGVRTALRPDALDPRPAHRPTHDPVLRDVRRRSAADRAGATTSTPIREVLPQLLAAVAIGVVGALALIAGAIAASGWLQATGVVLLGVGLAGGVLTELSRK